MLTDTHCHLASRQFPEDELPELLERAAAAGVQRIVTLATNFEDIPANLGLAERHPQVFACVGIHPCDVHETPDDFIPRLRELARHPRVVALGETGLDYYHPPPQGWKTDDYHERQRDFLRRHFELAAELGLNVVIHTRDRRGDASFADALEVYRPFASRLRAVFHCFPGPAARAQQVLDLGGMVSFTGIATFRNSAEVLDAAKHCPPARFMVETDAPYLAPVPHRGRRCEPAFAALTARSLAAARGESLPELASQTEQAAGNFFRFQPQEPAPPHRPARKTARNGFEFPS